jgi:hypothetical protein
MSPVFHTPREARKCLYNNKLTLVETFKAFFLEDALEAMNYSIVLRIEKALVN